MIHSIWFWIALPVYILGLLWLFTRPTSRYDE